MPPTFDDIFGQDAAIEAIRLAYGADRLPHGLIFAGPTGVGKATTAAALGALFLCERPKDTSACGKCASCKVFESGLHPDYHVIVKELIRYHDKTGKSKGIDLSINVIRPELLDRAALKPAMNIGKVFVIEQADLMTPQAQNAMLKTLEEPAGRALIILLTDQPGSLLPTVRSRSRLVPFAELPTELVREQLIQRGISKSDADRASAVARGSLGLAVRWLKEGVVDSAEQLFMRLETLEHTGSANDLPEFLRKSADGYANQQLEKDKDSSRDQAMREALGLFFHLASEQLRSRLTDESLSDDQREHCCDAIDAIRLAEINLDSNVTVSLLLQQLASALERALSGSARTSALSR